STAICVTRRDWEDAFASWLFSPPPVNSTANSNGRRTSRKQSPRVFPERSSTSSSIAKIRAAWTRPMRSSSSSAVRSSVQEVASPTFNRALGQFGRRALVDLVALMGNYAATAALLTAFDMQVDPEQVPPLPPP